MVQVNGELTAYSHLQNGLELLQFRLLFLDLTVSVLSNVDQQLSGNI